MTRPITVRVDVWIDVERARRAVDNFAVHDLETLVRNEIYSTLASQPYVVDAHVQPMHVPADDAA